MSIKKKYGRSISIMYVFYNELWDGCGVIRHNLASSWINYTFYSNKINVVESRMRQEIYSTYDSVLEILISHM